MRSALAIIVLVGCGRVSFDPVRDGGSSVDASSVDTPVGQACTADLECGRCARCDTTNTCVVEPITSLHLGHRSTCYIGAGGERWCAGENNDGQLGLGDTNADPIVTDRLAPERALDGGRWEQIFLYYYGAALGVRDGQFWSWGGNTSLVPTVTGPARAVRTAIGDLGRACFWELDGTSDCDPGPVWISIADGSAHTCGVKEDNTLWCKGEERDGDLGVPGLANGDAVVSMVQVGARADWLEVGVGGNTTLGFTCGRTTGKQVLCWGNQRFTGTGTTFVGSTPTLISDDTDWEWLTVHWERTCAGKAGGRVFCWGTDSYGGFVTPVKTEVLTATEIAGTYDAWIMGGHHACGKATTTGRWRCFGWNTTGQLGVGTTTNDGELVDLCP